MKMSKVLRVGEEAGQSCDESGDGIIGSSAEIVRLKTVIQRAGKLRILFLGETGVGKTPFARFSSKSLSAVRGIPRPFEQLNCAGLNREYFHDQLFGHKKGAFTGAVDERLGLVELASGGDLFLDEIGELCQEAQAMFLTFLDTQEFYRLGDDKKRIANVRIISATNRNLRKMVEEGTFRKDLYSRISQVIVRIPPLRDRREDIPLLIRTFIRDITGIDKQIDDEVIDLLREHNWADGNVRELRDCVEYICEIGKSDETMSRKHLDSYFDSADSTKELAEASSFPGIEFGLINCIETFERGVLTHFQKVCGGNVELMRKKLSVSRPTIYRRLKNYGLLEKTHITP